MKDKSIAVNRRAYHDYEILESLEGGLVLTGTEVKSLRLGRLSLQGGYIRSERGELWLEAVHIPPYPAGGIYNHPPTRPRKLLLHRQQIDKLIGQASTKGFTLVPLRLYFKKGKAKVEVGLARGKKLYDKRRALQEREVGREMERALKDKKVRR